jgi:protein O-GlcNAc transferase
MLGQDAQATRRAVEPSPVSADPLDARQHFELARKLQRQGDPGEALKHFRRASELSPDSIESINAIGNCHRDLGELAESVAAYRRVLEARPDHSLAHNNLAVTLQDQGNLDEAIASFRRSLEIQPNDPKVHSNLLLCLNYHDAYSPEQIADEHRAFGRRFGLAKPQALRRTASPDGRIRIGYLSPDFRQHSVAFFIWPVLQQHDRERFEVTCYSDVMAADAVTELLMHRPERWRVTAGMSDDELAAIIERDQIDIFVELAGHTGGNRLPLLARRRVAPVQVTYLGYPNTTGLSGIDYRITDAIADPPGMSESQYTEQLVRLPDSFFTQLTIAGMPDVAPPPAVTKSQVTFAAFTNLCKVRPKTLKLWARLLQQVPRSRLLLQAKSLIDPATRAAVAGVFASAGIAPDRINLRGWVDFPQYIDLYRDVDIVLDTFPFNGHTTTCQSLWMGVPVVTHAGDAHRSRMGASVLTQLNLSELVAQSEDDYVRIASDLAGDLPRLEGIRAGLRQRVQQSPYMDTQRFTRNLEAAYEEMVRRHEATALRGDD